MMNKYPEAVKQDERAIKSDWEALNDDFHRVGDEMAAYMVGASALFGVPCSPEAIKRLREAQRERTLPIDMRRLKLGDFSVLE